MWESKVFVDGGELTRNNDRKRKSEVLQAYLYPFSDNFYKGDWGKYDVSCGFVFRG